jgi:hypothetical protein
MLDEHVPFLEGTRVEQQLEALARRQFAAAMLRLDAAIAAAGARRLPLLFQAVENSLHGASQPVMRRDSIGGYRAPEPLANPEDARPTPVAAPARLG